MSCEFKDMIEQCALSRWDKFCKDMFISSRDACKARYDKRKTLFIVMWHRNVKSTNIPSNRHSNKESCEHTGNSLGHMDEGMKQAAGFTLHIYIAVHQMTF